MPGHRPLSPASSTHTHAETYAVHLPSRPLSLRTRNALELEVAWGDCVLAVSHLRPPRDYWVGEAEARSNAAPLDFALPSMPKGGAERLIVVRDDRAFVRLIEGAHDISRTVAGEELESFGATDVLLLGCHELEITEDTQITLSLQGLRFRIQSVELPARTPRALGLDLDALSYLGLTAVSAGGLLASLAYFVPPLRLHDDEAMSKARRLALAQYLSAAAEREQSVIPAKEDARPAGDGGTQGASSPGESGATGRPTAARQRTRLAVQGPPDNPDPHLARQQALRELRETGMVGLLTAVGGDPRAPTAPFGRDTSLGIEPTSAEGEMWGDTIADAFGHGGPGLSGIGDGGGVRGIGIGLHQVGSIGGGHGHGPGGGFGNHHGRLQEGRAARVPRVRQGPTDVLGRIPPEVIQRIVRQNFGRFRLCYEDGLQKNPNLEGRVAVRFMIGRDGRVLTTMSGGSDLPDSHVTTCVLGAFYGLSFPPPEGGNVEVTYPIVFTPE